MGALATRRRREAGCAAGRAEQEVDLVLARAIRFRGRRGRQHLLVTCSLLGASVGLSVLLALTQPGGRSDVAWVALLGTTAAQWLAMVPCAAALVAVGMMRHRRSGQLDAVALTGRRTGHLFRSLVLAQAWPGVAYGAALLPLGLTAGACLGLHDLLGYGASLGAITVQCGCAAYVAATIAILGFCRGAMALREAWVWVFVGLGPGAVCWIVAVLWSGPGAGFLAGAMSGLIFAAPLFLVAWVVSADALRKAAECWPPEEEDDRRWA